MQPTKAKAYREKAEARVREMEARIETLRAKAQAATADAKIRYLEQVGKLEKKLDGFRERLQRLSDAGEEVVDELREEAEAAWVEIKTAAQHLAEKFSK
jgi:nucleoside-triphosphatase THEP1